MLGSFIGERHRRLEKGFRLLEVGHGSLPSHLSEIVTSIPQKIGNEQKKCMPN
jgi:hypothetical protein